MGKLYYVIHSRSDAKNKSFHVMIHTIIRCIYHNIFIGRIPLELGLQ